MATPAVLSALRGTTHRLSKISRRPELAALYPFLAFALLGRVIWTFAYLGLGYALGGSIEAGTEFLKNLTGVLLSLSVLAISAVLMYADCFKQPPSISQ